MRPDSTGISISVVAVGPGDPSLITLQGREELRKADLVVGFKTVLNVVEPWLGHAETRPMTYRDQEDVLEYTAAQARQGRRCVLCCWGDLNFSAKELLARVKRRAENVELYPAISSIQIACAKAGISMEESVFVTLHQRQQASSDIEEAVHYLNEGRRHVILLPRPFDLMPPAIAEQLVQAGIPEDRRVTVFQRLTLDGEQQWTGNLKECSSISEEFSDLSIMVIFCQAAGGYSE